MWFLGFVFGSLLEVFRPTWRTDRTVLRIPEQAARQGWPCALTAQVTCHGDRQASWGMGEQPLTRGLVSPGPAFSSHEI